MTPPRVTQLVAEPIERTYHESQGRTIHEVRRVIEGQDRSSSAADGPA